MWAYKGAPPYFGKCPVTLVDLITLLATFALTTLSASWSNLKPPETPNPPKTQVRGLGFRV